MPIDPGEGVAVGPAGPVEVVARAARILRLLGESTAELTTAQIAERSGLPRSTVRRIVHTLHELRLVVREPRGRLCLGPELARLAADARIELVRAVQPHLTELSRSVGETAGLAVLDGPRVRFLDSAPADRPAPVSLVCSVPAHCTANGKALLAQLPGPVLEAALPDRLPRLTPRSIATRAELRAELDRVRRDGLAFSREEYADGVCGVGIAIHDAAGAVGAITVAAPATRFYGHEGELAGALSATVARVNADLAFAGLRAFADAAGQGSPTLPAARLRRRTTMDDSQVLGRIDELVAEEQKLYEREGHGQLEPGDRRRLDEIRVGLDRCWDLLRQRRAQREFGLDPDDARVRSAETVEHYEQ